MMNVWQKKGGSVLRKSSCRLAVSRAGWNIISSVEILQSRVSHFMSLQMDLGQHRAVCNIAQVVEERLGMHSLRCSLRLGMIGPQHSEFSLRISNYVTVQCFLPRCLKSLSCWQELFAGDKELGIQTNCVLDSMTLYNICVMSFLIYVVVFPIL